VWGDGLEGSFTKGTVGHEAAEADLLPGTTGKILESGYRRGLESTGTSLNPTSARAGLDPESAGMWDHRSQTGG
jgi:hypothetical protein